jgi:uncharacterized protein (UPF0261 family)
MAKKPRVLLIITLDTKEAEAKFVRKCLEDAGVDVVHLDASIRKTLPGAEIGPEQIAAAAGKTIEEVRSIGHEGKCQAVMTEGAIKLAVDLHRDEGLSAVLAIGGSMGTVLATGVMRALPFGLPKVMVSTMASGMTRPYVGTRDILMMHSVADISGLNSVTRSVFRNGALAAAGMAHGYLAAAGSGKPLVLITTLGTTERCANRVRAALEERGFETVVFHTNGTGGLAMDEIAREQNVAVVVDLSLVEVADFLHNGLLSAGPDRCKAALEKGVPVVFAAGNIDFVVAGPLEDAKARFPGKRYHVHNAALTAVRTEAPELKRVAEHMAGLIAQAKGPVAFFVPMLGFSAHDSPEGHLHDLSMPPVFAAHLKKVMPKGVPVIEVPRHINDPEFADAVIAQVIKFQHAKQT